MTIERARALDPAALHESVDGEWSFTETLRHLSYATAAWLHRAIQGDPSPWDPLDLQGRVRVGLNRGVLPGTPPTLRAAPQR